MAFCTSAQFIFPTSSWSHSPNLCQRVTPRRQLFKFNKTESTTIIHHKIYCNNSRPSSSSSSSKTPILAYVSQLVDIPSTVCKSMVLAGAVFILSLNPEVVKATTIFTDTTLNLHTNVRNNTPLNGSPQRWSNPEQQESNNERVSLHAHWDVHSVDSRTETILVFSNTTSSVIDLWWIDYCGSEVFYGSINPGTTHVQPSFSTHAWCVREHLSQNSLLVLVATPSPIMAVVKSI